VKEEIRDGALKVVYALRECALYQKVDSNYTIYLRVESSMLQILCQKAPHGLAKCQKGPLLSEFGKRNHFLCGGKAARKHVAPSPRSAPFCKFAKKWSLLTIC
jgi:hypothetical protein